MKQRLFIWLLLIIAVFGCTKLYNIITTPKTELIIEYNSQQNPELIGLRNIKINKTTSKFNLPNANVIITTDNNKKLSEYKEYNNFLTSPFVLFVGNNAREIDSGFSLTNVSSDISYRQVEKNLQDILIAIEEGKSWQDIGIKESVLSGKVKLAIPNRNNYIHNNIVKLFAINLVDELTTENLEETINRVDKIIEKCEHIENIETFISNQANSESPQIALIAPEYYAMSDNTSEYFYSNYIEKNKNTFFIPVYLTKTVSINYNLFISNNLSSEIQKNILKKYSSKTMMTTIGLRPTTNNINFDNINHYLKTDINIIELSSEIETTLKEHKTPNQMQITEDNKTQVENNTETTNKSLIVFIVIISIILLIIIIAVCWCFSQYYF